MKRVVGVAAISLFLVSCGTSKARLAERDKISSASGMYCEFISGDIHNDIDIELNMQMGKRCDSSKPFSITNYKNSSENFGVVYCCAIAGKKGAPQTPVESRHFGPKEEEPKVELAKELPPKEEPAPRVAPQRPSTTRTAPPPGGSAPSKPADSELLGN
jgi:hypothetical protein